MNAASQVANVGYQSASLPDWVLFLVAAGMILVFVLAWLFDN